MLNHARHFAEALTQKHSYDEALKKFSSYTALKKAYVDYDDNLATLTDDSKKLVVLRGMRGSGKTIAFLVATDEINCASGGKRVALFFDCKKIADALKSLERDGINIRDDETIEAFIQIEFGKQLMSSIKQLLKHAKRAGIDDKFRRVVSNGPALKPLQAKVKQAESDLTKALKSKRSIELVRRSARKRNNSFPGFKTGKDRDVSKPAERNRSIHVDINLKFEDWHNAISETKVTQIFMFFDEFSEPDVAYRKIIARMIQKIVSDSQKSEKRNPKKHHPEYCIRFAVYPSERSFNDMFRGLRMGKKRKKYAEPYLKRLFDRKALTTVDDLNLEGGLFVGKVIERAARTYKLRRNSKAPKLRQVFAIKRKELDIFLATMYSIGGGSIRRLMQIVVRALNANNVSLPLTIADLQLEGQSYWAHYLSCMCGDSNDDYTDETDEFEELPFITPNEVSRLRYGRDLIDQQVRDYLENEETALINTRYIPIFRRDLKYVLPLAERGVLYPVNEHRDIQQKETIIVFSLCGAYYDKLDLSSNMHGVSNTKLLKAARRIRRQIKSRFDIKLFDD